MGLSQVTRTKDDARNSFFGIPGKVRSGVEAFDYGGMTHKLKRIQQTAHHWMIRIGIGGREGDIAQTPGKLWWMRFEPGIVGRQRVDIAFDLALDLVKA